MKINITKEDEELYWGNYFKIAEELISGNNKVVYTIESTKENPTKDDKLIAKIQAKKFGFTTNDAGVVIGYIPVKDYIKELTGEHVFDGSVSLNHLETKVIQETLKRTVKHEKTDPIVESVCQKLLDRSEVGLKKYNSSIFDNIDENYLKHLQEELLDGANYCEQVLRLGEFTKTIIEILQSDQNEMSVGEKIIREYNKLKENK